MLDGELRGPAAADPDVLSRVVKIALDTGEAQTLEAAYELFRSYRLGVRVGRDAARSAAHQAALLTIVNAGRRAMLGGVEVVGDLDAPLLVPFAGCARLGDAVVALSGAVRSELSNFVPALLLGDAERPPTSPVALEVTFGGWRGGVIPAGEGGRIGEKRAIAPAAVLAGAIAVGEVFQHLRGNPMAGRRSVGLSLWEPGRLDWSAAADGPSAIVLPSRLWLIGLGHLGQAYLWTLGLLPYRDPAQVELVLQDFDSLTLANDSTSLLTRADLVGRLKTRAMAEWAEARGFRTRVVERAFPGGIKLADDEPTLALGGVDNPQARAAFEDAGFDAVIEAGLGAGTSEYLAMRMHAFPASVTARAKWGGREREAAEPRPGAYADLARRGIDRCGLVRLASRTVGAPFVGAAAAALVVSEVLRRLNGGCGLEVVDMTLRDPRLRSVVAGIATPTRFNPGFTR
jgi:hypothetical protein